MEKLLKKHADKFRFGIVGAINTVIDFGVLFILVNLGLPTIISNFASTSTALIFSFFANKKFTFKDNSKNHKSQIVRFFVVTLFGLWVIQPVIIEGVRLLIVQLSIDQNISLLVGKTLATCTTLVWNYTLYSRTVFLEEDIK